MIKDPQARAESYGAFALVLHSHLPYVLAHDRLEEEWLFAAVVESYLLVLGAESYQQHFRAHALYSVSLHHDEAYNPFSERGFWLFRNGSFWEVTF